MKFATLAAMAIATVSAGSSITMKIGNYASEVSWEIIDKVDGTKVCSGGQAERYRNRYTDYPS